MTTNEKVLEWYTCPICKKKLTKVDNSKKYEGVYVKCGMCKNEIEISNT